MIGEESVIAFGAVEAHRSSFVRMRNMTKVCLLIAAALVAGASRAGWESWLKTGVYHASFEMYEPGWVLSDEGAVNGTWGYPAVPAGADVRAESDAEYGTYMRCSTEGVGVRFTPRSTGNRSLKSVLSSMRLTAYRDALPDLSNSRARGAFSIYASENLAQTNFIGWVSGGWRMLQCPSIDPIPDQWYDVSMKFMQRGDDKIYVQYRVKRLIGEEFFALSDVESGESWFLAGGDSSAEIVRCVEFQGEGAFKYLTGSEPRRGMLISLVPWREMIVDETVYHHGTGQWYAFDYDTEQWLPTPVVKDGTYYSIDVPQGEDYTGFRPKNQSESESCEKVEFAVRFMAPNDNDATPTDDVCALVRIVESPGLDVTRPDLGYRFACLAGGSWYINEKIEADVNADYTIEVTLDKSANTVNYRVRKGLGGEAGSYESLLPDGVPFPVAIGDPLFSFFGGIGRVYSIKSSSQAVK